MSTQAKPVSAGHRAKNFVIGGVSGMFATTWVQPIDIIKVRIQILAGDNPGQKFGPIGVARSIMAESGFKSFYAGYDSALMRQAIYTTARFGIFFNMSEYLKEKQGGGNLPVLSKMACSLTAGGLGSFIGCPADLILIRMQADKMLPPAERRNYSSVFNAFRRIPAEEGIQNLWKGGVPTMIRAMALNLAMFTTYEEAKERMAKMMPNNIGLSWVLASFIAGTAAATASLPFDNAKTKMQKMKPDANGVMPYKNIFHCMALESQANGVLGLWAGLPTFIFRIAPHVMITFITAEKLRGIFLK